MDRRRDRLFGGEAGRQQAGRLLDLPQLDQPADLGRRTARVGHGGGQVVRGGGALQHDGDIDGAQDRAPGERKVQEPAAGQAARSGAHDAAARQPRRPELGVRPDDPRAAGGGAVRSSHGAGRRRDDLQATAHRTRMGLQRFRGLEGVLSILVCQKPLGRADSQRHGRARPGLEQVRSRENALPGRRCRSEGCRRIRRDAGGVASQRERQGDLPFPFEHGFPVAGHHVAARSALPGRRSDGRGRVPGHVERLVPDKRAGAPRRAADAVPPVSRGPQAVRPLQRGCRDILGDRRLGGRRAGVQGASSSVVPGLDLGDSRTAVADGGVVGAHRRGCGQDRALRGADDSRRRAGQGGQVLDAALRCVDFGSVALHGERLGPRRELRRSGEGRGLGLLAGAERLVGLVVRADAAEPGAGRGGDSRALGAAGGRRRARRRRGGRVPG